jgi:hypothetical protein
MKKAVSLSHDIENAGLPLEAIAEKGTVIHRHGKVFLPILTLQVTIRYERL